jgi:hypothetical protein
MAIARPRFHSSSDLTAVWGPGQNRTHDLRHGAIGQALQPGLTRAPPKNTDIGDASPHGNVFRDTRSFG